MRGDVTLGATPVPWAFRFTVSEQSPVPYSIPARPRYRHPLRGAALPLPARPHAAHGHRHHRRAGRVAGGLMLTPYNGPGQNGPMIMDGLAARLVQTDPGGSERPTSRSRRSPAARPHLVAGLHPAPGVRPGRGDHRQHELPDGRHRPRRQRLHRRPARLQAPPQRHRVHHRLRPDPLQPHLGGRAGRRCGDRQHLPGDRPPHRPRPQGMAPLDDVPLANSVCPRPRLTTVWPFDYFHLNSIDVPPPTAAAALLAQHLGAVRHQPGDRAGEWEVGGKDSTSNRGPGTETNFQHDATRCPTER